MKSVIQIIFILFFFVHFFAGCEKSNGPRVSTPRVQLECQIDGCDGSILETAALVLLSRSGCTNDFDIVASSTASFSCALSGCSGTTSGWVDEDGESVTGLSSGVYDLCVLVDRDGSGHGSYTAGDLVFEDSVFVGNSDVIEAEGSNWTFVD